ncbi:uncharacterized protein BDZ99DRAFT_563683 [Mytilinidion resinicola]|uniref:DUF6546 domain-containing protein n=1 Tax=Mytilinidion resinicola TaxID=574789 RepID=A0A6A6YPQ6_9PEZI|nr:uncharacterized protein BDZ99DRAFT_563683 [Mytilinidion resinicola]KAF2810508.1 hypothetical protein BDZ99DRAFT_563683 [Mytilinidion resinicola]
MNSLKKLVIFEDFNDTYIAIWQGVHELFRAEPVRIANSAVTRALAEASLTLEYLSAAFIVDAGPFLDACQSNSNWTWKELVSLTITSRQLVPDGDPTNINDMLE